MKSGVPTLVAAGYGSWAKAQTNPASEILALLQDREWEHFNLVTLEVPVLTETLYKWAEEMLLTYRPAAWMGIGVAPSSTALRLEMTGVNWRHFDVPDNAGTTMSCEPIVKDGPCAYDADFPNREIVMAHRAAGIPSMLSFHAGTHLCNQMLYTVSHLLVLHGMRARCGFLHVPLSPGNIVHEAGARLAPSEISASMDLKTMAEGAAIALNHAHKSATQ